MSPIKAARIEAFDACRIYNGLATSAGAEFAAITSAAADEAKLAAEADHIWRPLSDSMSVMAALPDNGLTQAQLATSAKARKQIKAECNTAGVTIDPGLD